MLSALKYILLVLNELNQSDKDLFGSMVCFANWSQDKMIKFKRPSSLKLVNPMKSIKLGFKLRCLAEDKGYVCKFDIYCGKNDSTENSTLGLGGNIVMKLVNHLPVKYHKVYFDSLFHPLL